MESTAEEKRGLVAEAARVAEAAGATGIGSLRRYLDAYYWHVSDEDLVVAGALRMGSVAAAHARLAAHRPQGRALVTVRPPATGNMGAFDPSRGVVDLVTDDMPFLVQSVLMELRRHDLDAPLVVHPQLLVRRDVAGALREVCGALNGCPPGAGTIPESWVHIEVEGLTADRAADLQERLQSVLDDVRVVVEDQSRMAAAAIAVADELALEQEGKLARELSGELASRQAGARGTGPAGAGGADAGGGAGDVGGGAGDVGGGVDSLAEAEELLRWLARGHFTFLGYREYDLIEGPEGMALRTVPGTGLGILRHDRPGSRSFASLPPEVRAKATEPERLILTKANSRSTVLRPSYLDYVGVKKFSATGEVTGERRFLGLYTHDAYTESIVRIPVLRRKLADVLSAAGFTPDSYDGKDLIEVLDGYPREELFQISAAELTPIAVGVLRLRERRQTRLFLRADPYGRYMSAMVYLPRERYTTHVRLRALEILQEAFDGHSADYSVQVGEPPLARLHVVVRGKPGQRMPEVDAEKLERELAAAVRSWDDDLAEEARRRVGERRARELLAAWLPAVPEAYKADVRAADAVGDLTRLLALPQHEGVSFHLAAQAAPGVAGQPVTRLKVYRCGSAITLTEVLPRLQNMGVEVVDEHPYEFAAPGLGQRYWIYDFGLLRHRAGAAGAAQRGPVDGLFEDTLAALWQGKIEDDGFNALVLGAGLSWRQVVVLRAYAKYLRQAGTTFSQRYLEHVLAANVGVTRLLVRLFESRFDPARQRGQAERSEAIAEEIRGQLDEVAILDHDRILRSYLGLILATLRTNYFQVSQGAWRTGPPERQPYLVLKLDAASIPELPAPRPRFELFVYSPRLEAVHLRFGTVARGGLRWSDRREDFRTEILGLARAQEVKNSVIVPSGAKGGFVCKNLPDPSDREAYQAEVRACYQTFIRAMLDVTDNLRGGQVVPPAELARHDGDDPYLVVAADKGTATFSDLANEISKSYGYWLGDAFASGGSEGYDHKKMGITARGAWESVRFHFATLGLDPATSDFTAVGIGDMSGDVFGNGMLLSRHIKLLAAFDHRHVFLDPDPDPAVSFAERRRLFALPRSSWADYDPALISPGGGVWPRTAKAVPISPQARAALGLDDSVVSLAPDQVISAILAAPVDLLWNGGIGTYVKASTETHQAAGDRANDGVRINATQLRARVVAEGGNLGLTQAARIEYALAGGLVNTDFIDNSAGVDTSDHEVNIKILLQGSVEAGELTPQARGELLHEMTGEVAALVLRENYRQNRVLAAAREQAPQMLHVHARYLRKLEREGRLRRELEALPGDREIAERRSAGLGLTVPEFAVLLAQAKISAVREVLGSDLPDDPYLRSVLADYFPAPLRSAFAERMASHPLRREIITTTVVNEMVNRSGTTFLFRINEETGASVPDITRAWIVAREVFDLPGFWAQVEALDAVVGVGTQISLLLEGRKLAERATRWLLHNRRPPFGILATLDFLADGVLAVGAALPRLLTGRDRSSYFEREEALRAVGVPPGLAHRVAAMVPAYSAFDIVEVAASTRRSVEEAAEVYFDLADRLQITRLRDQIVALPRDDRWNSMARSALRDDVYAAHAAITRDVLTVTAPGTPEERLAAWAERNAPAVRGAAQTLSEIWGTERFSVATLSVAVRAIRTLVASSSLPA
jgi:glutamate dehydrogenase